MLISCLLFGSFIIVPGILLNKIINYLQGNAEFMCMTKEFNIRIVSQVSKYNFCNGKYAIINAIYAFIIGTKTAEYALKIQTMH